ncbi:YDG domain-containing protein [Limnohabitans sp. 15K]|uniref:YDG domain-containing protein n=1 Tax=Limnohabitans sp. 15K TaxID=1100706 RepID=UPI000C1E1FA4|nr:YDG domain-containing protein [Limnohabitans sp. 15K]PIT81889.1 hypothetical protein B9Z40_09880 [Limnohabitans sp. 15K]
MNSQCFKNVFSKRLGCLVAVGEHASIQGKANGASMGRSVVLYAAQLTAACVLVSMAWAGPAGSVSAVALPSGGQLAQGVATVQQAGAVMNIHQSTSKAVMNWNSFDIGTGAKVNIVQPGADAVMLNRVSSANPSQILGQLNANGQVVLVNPNGILFGKDGSVNASSFTASTLGINDANFMAGNHQFERNGSTASVVNQGSIKTNGGYVALLGASVSNEGSIQTQGGAAYLAAAETVRIPISGSGRIKLELSPSRINAAVANAKGGTIVTEGGQVYMQAAVLNSAVASIIQSGSIDTTGEQGGAVHLLADGGQIKVDGSITANSAGHDSQGQLRNGGDIVIGRDEATGALARITDVRGAKLQSQGGFVETSGHELTVDAAMVTASVWLLDPDNIDITGDAVAATAGYSKIKASDIGTALNAGTSVTVATTAANQVNQPIYKDTAGTGPGSAVTGDGNILVNAAIVKSGANNASLTLTADNGVTINQRIGKASGDNTSTGKLDVTMTASGNAATVTNRSGLTLNSVIDAGDGNVTLTGTNSNTTGGSRGVNFNNGSGITANTITVTGTATGAAEWNQGVLFAGTSSFKSTGSSVISGISSSTAGAINSAVVFNDGSNVTLDAGAGSLTVQGTHTVNGYGGIRFGTYGGSSTNPSLTTKGIVTLGTQDSSNASLNAGFMLRGGLITADTGSLTIKGQATGTGINLYDGYGTIKSNGGAITLNGVATTSGHGVYFNSNQVGTLNSGGDVTIIGSGQGGNQGVQFNGGNVRVYGNNVTINGTANTASGQTGYGFYSTIGPGSGNTITAAGNLSITGALNGAGSGTAVFHTSTNWQNLVNAYTAGGRLSITGTNNASASNAGATITMAGVQARAVGDLTISATTNNAATEAISVFSNSYLSGGAAPGYQGGASSFVSTGGNTILKSNQGSIFIQDGVPNSVTSTAITGKNVIIDNTGGTFTGGVFAAGSGTSTSTTRAGVQISDSLAANDLYLASNATRRTITASDAAGQIVLSGKSTGSASGYSVGVRIASTTSYVAPTTNLLGTSTASVGVYNTAAITTSKDLNITGVSTSQSNTQGGVTLNASITTGSTGKVDITSTDTAGGSNWAYNQNAGVNINAGSGGVTINATGSGSNSALNILGNITTTGAVSLTGNAGTGGGNGIYTSGTIGISGTSLTMNGIGGTTGGVGAFLNSGTTFTASTGDVSITASKPSSTSTAAINLAGTINGVSTKSINLTGGLTGAGSIVTNGAAVILNNAMSALDDYAGAISGTGSLIHQTGKQTISGTNTYSGSTSINGGTLQVGNGGATGTLGSTTGVTLTNNANLTFNKTVNTSIDTAISGNGNVTATVTGDLSLASTIALTGTNTINLTSSGAITETAGSLAATNLYLTATNGGIGAVGNRIQSDVSTLYVSAGGNVFVTEANSVTFAGRTTAGNGNIDVTTTNGTLTVNAVNSVGGITAHGTGNIILTGNAPTGHGISITNNITATNGDVNLTGTTASTTNPNAGVYSQSTVAAKNITMVASATSTTGAVLGYYGAGGVFNASQQLSLTGTSNSGANGLYSYTGSYLSGTGMTLVGSSSSGQGVGFDAGVTVTNTTSGGINVTGTATDSTKQAIGMQGLAMTNGGGNVSITASNGHIFSGVGNPLWGGVQTNTIVNNGTGDVQVVAGNGSATNSGSINGSVFTITQNGNAGVLVSTSGTGNVTSPKIINAGTGDIVVAAGSLIAAGTETGGQILTVAGNTLTQTNGTPGKTYVYSGAPSTTGVLSNLSTGFNNLYYQGTSAALNAGFGQGFDANHANDMLVPGGGSASGTQVFFRTATKPSFSMTLSNNNKAYGATDPVGYATTSGATLTNAVAGVGGNNTFAVTSADVLAGLTGGRAAGENVGSYAYSLSTGTFNTTLTAQPNLVIGRRDITLATLVASNKVYDGSTLATITSGTFGNLFNGETLLISGQGLFGTKDVANGKTVTVADVSTLTKANGTGNWNNYNLTTTSKTTTANITKAMLTATAIDDARFVTQADPANFLGARFSGFKLGDTEAVVDTSGVTVTRTNAVNDIAQGTYSGVLVPIGAAATNYDFTYVNGNYTILPARQLLVRTTSQSVVYGASPTFATTAAYLDGNGVTINNLTRTGTNNNYTFNDGAGTSVTMTLKPYNGSAVATLSTSGNTVVGSYNVKDLAYTQTGTNFLGTPVFVGTLSVTPKEITPNATGVSKVYDATTSIANVVVGMTGKITNDRVTIGGTGAFSQSTVGTNLGYSVTGVSLSSTDAGNYFLANGVNSFSGTDGAITRAALVATANSRTTTFNGAAQSVTGFTVAGLLGSDSEAGLVGISASGATGTNVGTYANTMTVANQTNYTVTGVNGALTIDPAPILATDISAALRGTVSKVYDGTTAATLTSANYLLTGWLGTDGATVSKTSGAYNNANVGVGKTVTVSLSNSDYQATGATNLSNYSLPSSVSGNVGVITKKDVTLTGFTAANKVYDGNTLATITASNILTGVGFETLSVRGTANFSDKNVGVSKLVSISDSSALVKVDGTGQWTNYNLLNSTATTTANITPKFLQASGLVADKVYDGTAQATLAGSAGVGVVTGDTVFLQAGSALFADKQVSRDATGQVVPKTVTVSGLALAGAEAGNYALSADSFQAQAKITPRLLDLQVSVNDKPYDGTTTATARAAASNLIAGDAVQWDLGAGFFASKDVSRNALGQPLAQQVKFDNLQMTGLDSGNYSLPFTSVHTSAFITPKVLTLVGSSVANKNVDGNTDATVTLGAVQGLVGAEQLAVSVSGRFQTATPGGNKPVDVKYSWSDGANGGKASNYALPDGVLLGRILSPQNDAIKPIVPPLKPVSGGGSVTIVAAQPAVASNFPASLPSPQAELVCTVTDLEPCDCEKTVLDGLDICLVPRNTQASRGNAGTSENGFTNRK